MGVSLEQTRILVREHGLDPNFFNQSLDKIRKEGTGLLRCYKNVSKYCYAFNAVQLSTFPREYKPPKGTYGSALS